MSEIINGIEWYYTTYTDAGVTYSSIGNGSGQATSVGDLITGSVTIPNTLGGYPVGAIENGAFFGCSDLTSVIFQSGSQLKTIGVQCFSRSGVGGSITLPASLKTISNLAFEFCSGLTSISFELGSLTHAGSLGIGSGAFTGIVNLTVNAHLDTITAMNWTISDSTSPPTLNSIGGRSGPPRSHPRLGPR